MLLCLHSPDGDHSLLKRIQILLALLLALVVSACSSQESTTPSPATPEPTPVATPAATPEQTDDGTTGSPGALPSFELDGDPELAGRFPDSVGGQPLEIQSLDGKAFAALGSDPVFDDFLGAVGAEPEDVSVAFGGAAIGDEVVSAGAFRVRGASEDELAREFIAASERGGEVPELSQETIGGKDVWTASEDSSGTEVQAFIYTKDDTLYFLTGSVESVTEILEALP
jgi:hypothetical protein